MTRGSDAAWLRDFNDLTSAIQRGLWKQDERETALHADLHGTTRWTKTCIVANGVWFTADNSVNDGATERSHPASVAADLTVEAVRATPPLATENQLARELLREAAAHVDGPLKQRIQQFLDDGGYAERWNARKGW